MRVISILMSICGLACVSAATPLSSVAHAQDKPSYALTLNLQENGENFAATNIIVSPGPTYLAELPASAKYELRVSVAPDTKAAAFETFERTLSPQEAANFIFVRSSLSRKNSDGDMEKVIGPSMLISLTGHEIVSTVPVASKKLLGHHTRGTLETLTVAVSGTPWSKTGYE